MSAETQLTPMMAQYRRIKGELPKDALLLFRLGDFYEMFFEDAQSGAQILNVALTKRGVVPMCGIQHHAFGAVEVADDDADHFQRMHVVGGIVIRHARPPGVHIRPA